MTLLAIFVFVELKVFPDQILPRYLWDDRIKVLGCAVAALTYAVWQGSNYLLTLQLQTAFSRIPIYIPLTNAMKRLRSLSPLRSPPLPPPRHASSNSSSPSFSPRSEPATSSSPAGFWLLRDSFILLTRMGSGDIYWRLCLPGMILYIAGIGMVYFVGNVTVVVTAKEEHQGTVSGPYNVSFLASTTYQIFQ